MKIRKIESPNGLPPEIRRKRVAAYARVSTRQEAQLGSLTTQIDYYEALIRGRGGWDFAGVYYDKGITGTSYEHREAFQRMIRDCEDGKIDMIITKSLSRFARNTVDTVETIRRLKDINVGVYFEKENIWTLDSKGEFVLTLMAGFAQEEARSVSESTAWGIRRRMESGKYWVSYSRFLGYGKDFVIEEEGARTVRRIYKYALQGYSLYQITKLLEANGDPTPSKRARWQTCTVKSILQNEKYKGDALCQKGFTPDYLSKKRIENRGQLPQYYVVGGHEPIVSPDLFDYVQEFLDIRAKLNIKKSGITAMSSRIICGKCGGIYGRKLLRSTDKYAHNIWQCRNRFRKGAYCYNIHFHERELPSLWGEVYSAVLNEYPGVKKYVRSVLLQAVNEESRRKSIDEALQQYSSKDNSIIEMDEVAILVEYITVTDRQVVARLFGGKEIHMTLTNKYRTSRQAKNDRGASRGEK